MPRIIDAPGSTKNREGKRDPEMRSTKKGSQWYFGMKAHIGVYSRSKLIHSVAATAANVHDSRVLPHLLHGEETRVWGDSAYRSSALVPFLISWGVSSPLQARNPLIELSKFLGPALPAACLDAQQPR